MRHNGHSPSSWNSSPRAYSDLNKSLYLCSRWSKQLTPATRRTTSLTVSTRTRWKGPGLSLRKSFSTKREEATFVKHQRCALSGHLLPSHSSHHCRWSKQLTPATRRSTSLTASTKTRWKGPGLPLRKSFSIQREEATFTKHQRCALSGHLLPSHSSHCRWSKQLTPATRRSTSLTASTRTRWKGPGLSLRKSFSIKREEATFAKQQQCAFPGICCLHTVVISTADRHCQLSKLFHKTMIYTKLHSIFQKLKIIKELTFLLLDRFKTSICQCVMMLWWSFFP